MSQKWKREETELLITTIQQYPCLYDIRSTDYLDRTKKAMAFNCVLEVMQNSMSTVISLSDIKQRWKNIRTQYVQELRTMQNSKRFGKSDEYAPKLWCYNQLSFLKTNTKMRHSEDNIKENDENNVINDLTGGEDESYFEDSQQKQKLEESYIEEPPQKKKRTINVEEIRSDLANLKNTLVERKREKKFAWLGMLVATQIEAMDVEEQDDAVWQVQCLMRKLTSKQNNVSRTNSLSSKDILELSMDETKPYIENSLDMQEFSEISSVDNAKTALAHIDTGTTQVFTINVIKNENLTTQETACETECPVGPNSFEELEKVKDLNERLIDEVKRYDCIYNTQSEKHKDYNYKQHLFHKIGKSVGLTANDAYRKWRNIKDTYRKYKLKAISENAFFTPYKYANSLKFLDDFFVYQPSKSIVVPEPEVITGLSNDGDMLYAPSLNQKKETFEHITETSETSSLENFESEAINPSITSSLFVVLANKVNEADLTSQQKNAIEFGVSSFVYSKLGEYSKE